MNNKIHVFFLFFTSVMSRVTWLRIPKKGRLAKKKKKKVILVDLAAADQEEEAGNQETKMISISVDLDVKPLENPAQIQGPTLKKK